jgi:amino acid transporter
MSMSRDGLLPKAFSKVHPKYHTPYISTIVTALMVAIPSLFMQSSLMTDLTSIGTLFAFVLVAGGVLMLPRNDAPRKGGFKLPYINGQFIVPILFAVFVYFSRTKISHAINNLGRDSLQEILFLVFILFAGLISVLTIMRKYSLIPVLGMFCCAYLLIEIPAKSWMYFFVWMGIGLTIYFIYGYKKSKLAKES